MKRLLWGHSREATVFQFCLICRATLAKRLLPRVDAAKPLVIYNMSVCMWAVSICLSEYMYICLSDVSICLGDVLINSLPYSRHYISVCLSACRLCLLFDCLYSLHRLRHVFNHNQCTCTSVNPSHLLSQPIFKLDPILHFQFKKGNKVPYSVWPK